MAVTRYLTNSSNNNKKKKTERKEGRKEEKKSKTTMAPNEIEQPALGRVLVIGGCGFLGHHVVRVLLRDWKCSAVSVIDLRCARNRRPASDGVEYVEADITDGDGLAKAIARLAPDVVIHTASPPAQGSGAVVDSLFKRVNVDGTRAVVAACQQAGVKALVYTSSASVMSDNASDLINANEEYPVIRGKAQTEYYSETKVSNQFSQSSKRADQPTDLYIVST